MPFVAKSVGTVLIFIVLHLLPRRWTCRILWAPPQLRLTHNIDESSSSSEASNDESEDSVEVGSEPDLRDNELSQVSDISSVVPPSDLSQLEKGVEPLFLRSYLVSLHLPLKGILRKLLILPLARMRRWFPPLPRLMWFLLP